ncbi:MAG: TrkA family potassium uptake protein [Clostridia bacterium]|nr:TrkA family potassium uptake protein [Clostridia bacterium]
MKSVLIIGLGSFGKYAALKYMNLGCEVMVVDSSEELVNEMAPYVTSAQIADCTKPEVLKAIGVKDFDICLVAIGDNFQSSLEITSLLKDFGAPYVISKAIREIQEKFLLRNGADLVVYPDKGMAERLAIRTTASNVLDFFNLTETIAIYEIAAPKSWIGKSIINLDVRKKYNISIVAIKSGSSVFIPEPDHVFESNQDIVVIGYKDDIGRLSSAK